MVIFQKFQKGLLALPFHHSGHLSKTGQHVHGIVGNLRTSKPQNRLRENFFDLPCQLLHIIQIPNVAGKAEQIRLFPVQIHKNLIHLLVDRIL